MTLVRIGDQTDILGECPLWHFGEGALYWVDIRAPAVRRYATASGTLESWTMPDLVGSIAFTDDGRLIVAVADRLDLFDRRTGTFTTLAKLPDPVPGHRFNDGRCDRQGRFWIGTMHNVTRAPEGTLFRFDPGVGLLPVVHGISIPNSLAFSPDGNTLYFADSLTYEIRAYDYDSESGVIGAGRSFVRTAPPAFADGSAIDSHGYLWNAEFNGARIVRYTPDGRIDRVVPLLIDKPTCCAFGGPELKTLFITSTSQHLDAAGRAREPLAGALFALDVDVAGLPEPVCRLAPRPRS
jgi:sugar lactone lactonase YvrE